jgi:hypothetical protein
MLDTKQTPGLAKDIREIELLLSRHIPNWSYRIGASDLIQSLHQALEMAAEIERLKVVNAELLAELNLIVKGWEEIELGHVRGRALTLWEAERLAYARAALSTSEDEDNG